MALLSGCDLEFLNDPHINQASLRQQFSYSLKKQDSAKDGCIVNWEIVFLWNFVPGDFLFFLFVNFIDTIIQKDLVEILWFLFSHFMNKRIFQIIKRLVYIVLIVYIMFQKIHLAFFRCKKRFLFWSPSLDSRQKLNREKCQKKKKYVFTHPNHCQDVAHSPFFFLSGVQLIWI